MRRDAPTSEPGGSARLRMAIGHANVNYRLAVMSRGLREGTPIPRPAMMGVWAWRHESRGRVGSKERDRMKQIGALLLLWCAWSMGFAATGSGQMANEEKVYRTGLTGKRGAFSVSPDGSRLIFDIANTKRTKRTERVGDGLKLLDLRSGKVETLSLDPRQDWAVPRWSFSGRELVAASMAMRNDGYYNIDETQVSLLDPVTWKHRTISSGDGIKVRPFFSADGKTVYYFKGRRRKSGATFASRYDLYAIDLEGGSERRLTHGEFYQIAPGDDDGRTLLLAVDDLRYPSRYFDKTFGEEKDQTGLFVYNKANETLDPLPIDQTAGIFNFYRPRRDRAGNVYFITNTSPPRSDYKFWLARATPDGKNPRVLTEVAISADFDIAQDTGEIYVMDTQGDEIVFRRLSVRADH